MPFPKCQFKSQRDLRLKYKKLKIVWWYWDLNSGPYIFQANVLPLKPCSETKKLNFKGMEE
jgi:hypothetical protein